MRRIIIAAVTLLAACSAAPIAEEPFVPGAPGDSAPTDPCDAHATPAAWVRDSALSALQDQMASICACFREDAEGVRLYVAAYLMVDGQVRVDVLGHRSSVGDQVACFQDRTSTALINWVSLGGGWFEQDLYLPTPPKVFEWEGMSCAASAADLPINGPLLSDDWLATNPDGLLYPAEMPPSSCYAQLRTNVRINFAMEVRPPEPDCKDSWHPQGCQEK